MDSQGQKLILRGPGLQSPLDTGQIEMQILFKGKNSYPKVSENHQNIFEGNDQQACKDTFIAYMLI